MNIQVRYHLLSAFLLFFFFLSCEPEEEKLIDSPRISINFSTDTVQFDTVLTGTEKEVTNITKRLSVYNPQSKAVLLSAIKLAGAPTSPFQLFINGIQSDEINNLTLLGGDSLLILIELQKNSDDKALPYLLKDSIVFQLNGNVQDVKLIAYGQDAHYINKGYLPCSQVWESGKAYVLKDTVWVGENCLLTITKGAKIYFDNNAALMVEGTLKATGAKDERITFNNSRLDVKNQFGLWSGIHFAATSKDNQILYSDIRNTNIAISLAVVDTDTLPDLILGHSKIENTSGPGIFAKSTDLYVYNTLINNSTTHIVENIEGGNYTYEHCTLVNYATFGFSTKLPVVLFKGASESNDDPQPLSLKLYNNIIWSGGNLPFDSDLQIDSMGGAYNVDMGNNLIRSVDESQEINNNILNRESDFPDFVGIFQYNYRPDSLSPAIDEGLKLNYLLDLEGDERDSLPDIGAYEYRKIAD